MMRWLYCCTVVSLCDCVVVFLLRLRLRVCRWWERIAYRVKIPLGATDLFSPNGERKMSGFEVGAFLRMQIISRVSRDQKKEPFFTFSHNNAETFHRIESSLDHGGVTALYRWRSHIQCSPLSLSLSLNNNVGRKRQEPEDSSSQSLRQYPNRKVE